MANHDKISLHQKHIEAVHRKHETLKGKIALLETWAPLDDGNDEVHAYVNELKVKARNVKNQLCAMRPVSERNRNNYDD